MLQALIPLLGVVFDRVLPDPIEAGKAKLAVMELVQRGELAALTAEPQLALGQIEVNRAEAASGDRWAAGWRPLVGHVCAVALAWDTILKPMVIFGAAVAGHPLPAVPDLSSDQLYGLLGGMLGLGRMRTVEKVKRAASAQSPACPLAARCSRAGGGGSSFTRALAGARAVIGSLTSRIMRVQARA